MEENKSNDRVAPQASVKESVIRMMTRLATECGAVNLSQGFPNEAPPRSVRLALAHAVLTGRPPPAETGSDLWTEEDFHNSLLRLLSAAGAKGEVGADGLGDQLNQYSPPMGRPDLRQAIAGYYQRFYDYQVSPDDVTVTLGATEAFASALRTVGRPGDRCVVFEPFHELYPSQCKIFYLEPFYVTLREGEERWEYDNNELEDAMNGARVLMLNTPHNPTGKVFSLDELRHIVSLCTKYNVYLITDEIYEHMCFGDDTNRHYLIPKEFPEIADMTLVCNSLGKSASATGWRVGWCLHPPHLRDTYRGIHDQLAVMSPHPMQYATLTYLSLPDEYFASLSGRYQRRVEMLSEALIATGFEVLPPQGAYYLFVNYKTVPVLSTMSSFEAAMYLLKEIGVACVPGDNFFGKAPDDTNNKYLRFAACRSNQDLEEAARRLQALG